MAPVASGPVLAASRGVSAHANRVEGRRRLVSSLVASLLLLAVSLVLHQIALRGNPRVPGGTRAGMVLGVVAAALVLFASLLGVRRRYLALPLGGAATWRWAHLVAGVLACVIALLHAGPRAGGPLGVALLGPLAVVSVSGLVGAWIQQALPAALGAASALAGPGTDARPALPALARRWLHGWLLLHVPLSLALLVLMVVHAVAALRF